MQPDFSKIVCTDAVVTYLEMYQPQPFPTEFPGTGFELLTKPVSVHVYRKLYFGVGEKHSWLDRMVMPDEELYQKINDPNIDIYVFNIEKVTAGFFEFIVGREFTEILYFGLLPDFVGKGYGKYFLSWAIAKAWSYNPQRIQLNTCTLDHPNALPNYLNAGFEIVKTEIQQRRIIP